MFEFSIRLALALGFVSLSWFAKWPAFEPAWKLSTLFATYSMVLSLLEKRGLRNSGVAGIAAVIDSAAISFALYQSKLLDSYGFISLLPIGWAAFRFQSDALSMAPISAASMLVISNLPQGSGWTPPLLIQCGGTLVLGLLMARKEKPQVAQPVLSFELNHSENGAQQAEYQELRDKFRKMRDHAESLERSGRRDRFAAILHDTTDTDPTSPMASLAKKIREVCNVQGLSLYAMQQSSSRLVVHAVSGDVPGNTSDSSIDLPEFLSEWQLKDRLDSAIKVIKAPEDASHSSTVLLKDRGRILGILALFDQSKSRLIEAAEIATECSETIARMVRLHLVREEEKRRLRQTELLYTLSSVCQGADTTSSLASRVARELWETLSLDHLSIAFLESGEPMLAASHGINYPTLELMTFHQEAGAEGWIQSGAPEVTVANARDDDRFPRDQALKRRIGSFFVIPLSFSEDVYGYLSIGSQRAHGIDEGMIETTRLVAFELSRALGRVSRGNKEPEGMTTPQEFHQTVKSQKGFMVYLEMLRRDEMIESYGKTAMETASRKLGGKLCSILPTGALLCRRYEGDYVAFIRTDDEAYARSWAATAVTTAAMMTFTSLDGQIKIPVSLRSKVAHYTQQSNQISATGALG